jgi:hypothetical protein
LQVESTKITPCIAPAEAALLLAGTAAPSAFAHVLFVKVRTDLPTANLSMRFG